MKRTFPIKSIMDKILDVQKTVQDFYDRVAREAPNGAQELLTFMARSKGQQIELLSTIVERWVNQGKPVPTDYEEASNLYLIPSIHSKIFADLSKTLDQVDVTDSQSVADLALAIEKETALLYHGLKAALPERIVSGLDDIIRKQNSNVLSLHDWINELKGNIDDFLLAALHGELAAKRFYEDAAEKAESEAGRKLFGQLADFEQAHFSHIEEIIESRNAGVGIVLSAASGSESEPIHAAEGEVEPNRKGISEILVMAIEAEKNARIRYEKIATMLDDPKEKAIFEDLANSERVHQKILEDQFYQLSNEGTIAWT
ncbi:hypothetical protein Thimo_2729 [Thioflavicoccus mobilis 8321]|uniref:Rubrerythrin diiron-binding domain-containing protein n=1 Tax=Thioflavicoccus mobilis 8321 TaxID=765912 RepID=L0H1H5_9GAMM|nr:ferritin family protein [Thioflavicoccus mobilis]AGA91439.1 hypothetical protein Thimo_2729 [Thioflavicoccus mobilis 8321]